MKHFVLTRPAERSSGGFAVLSRGEYSEIAMTHTAHRYIVSSPEILSGGTGPPRHPHSGARSRRAVARRYTCGRDYPRFCLTSPSRRSSTP